MTTDRRIEEPREATSLTHGFEAERRGRSLRLGSILRTGAQWKALEATDLCARSTAHDRFQEWVEAGVFLRFWQVGVEQFDELHGIDWDWLSLDGAMTKAPLGREKREPIRPTAAKAESSAAC